MKSTIRRPSEYLPAGIPKKVSPLGGGAGPNAEERPPVSEFESPKLKIAGKLHGKSVGVAETPKNSTTSSTMAALIGMMRQGEAILQAGKERGEQKDRRDCKAKNR